MTSAVGGEPFEDFYAVLGVAGTATTSEISRAYRKLALQLHPDKTTLPAERAAHEFDRVTRARDTLLDAETRANFDAMLAARAARAARDRERDASQRDMLENLMRREADARAELKADSERSARAHLDADMSRLRAELRRHEASRAARRRERDAAMRDAAHFQNQVAATCLKVTWSDAAGEISERFLRDVFAPHGDVDAIVMARGGKREALVSFSSPIAAVEALESFEADDTFTVTPADAAATLTAAAAAASNAAAHDGNAIHQVASYEPYRPPVHPDVIGGVHVPQSPLDSALREHLAYEQAVLALLRSGNRPAATATTQPAR
jgi:curved DNA-binding protein CbpA